jgi:hypothetical protein
MGLLRVVASLAMRITDGCNSHIIHQFNALLDVKRYGQLVTLLIQKVHCRSVTDTTHHGLVV